jgi:hypothetical protein
MGIFDRLKAKSSAARNAANTPPRALDASAWARCLYSEVVRAEEERLQPAEFELPDSVARTFKFAAAFYLDASMLLALRTAAKTNTRMAEVLGEFEKLLVVGLDESVRAKYNVTLTEALEDLKLLFDADASAWRESGFARKWLARVGVVRFLTRAQPGAFSSVLLTNYRMSMPLVMLETIQANLAEEQSGGNSGPGVRPSFSAMFSSTEP